MKEGIILVLTLIIELILLFLVGVLFLFALVGTFLPVIPGIIFLGLGIALYLLVLNDKRSQIAPRFHPHVLSTRDKILKLKIIQNFMGLFKKIKKRKQEKIIEEILKNGLILLGFNVALILAFILGFISLSFLADILDLQVLFFAFIPLAAIFIFAGASAIVWYRFGQILGGKFKDRKALNASLVTLISILPLLVFMILFSSLIQFAGGFGNELVVVTFLGILLMSILSAAFELIIVSLGSVTAK